MVAGSLLWIIILHGKLLRQQLQSDVIVAVIAHVPYRFLSSTPTSKAVTALGQSIASAMTTYLRQEETVVI